jgi:hypothetical protein
MRRHYQRDSPSRMIIQENIIKWMLGYSNVPTNRIKGYVPPSGR